MKKIYKNKCDLLINHADDNFEINQYSPETPSEAALMNGMIDECRDFKYHGTLNFAKDLKDFDRNSEIFFKSTESDIKFNPHYQGDYFNCNGQKTVTIDQDDSSETALYIGTSHNNDRVSFIEKEISNEPLYGQLKFSSFKDSQGVCQNHLKVTLSSSPSIIHTAIDFNDEITSYYESESNGFLFNYQSDQGLEIIDLGNNERITKESLYDTFAFSDEINELHQCYLDSEALSGEESLAQIESI